MTEMKENKCICNKIPNLRIAIALRICYVADKQNRHRTENQEENNMERNEMIREIIKNFAELTDEERAKVMSYAARLASGYNQAPDAQDHREAV